MSQHIYGSSRIYLSPPPSEREVEIFAQHSRSDHHDPFEALTGREREVLQLTAEGQTGYAIANLLGIRARTAENHRANLPGSLFAAMFSRVRFVAALLLRFVALRPAAIRSRVAARWASRMTARYSHLSPDYLAEAMGKLDGVFGAYCDRSVTKEKALTSGEPVSA